jgi:hypothetical protein
MNDTTTPRTDERYWRDYGYQPDPPSGDVMRDFARQLERELSEVTKQRNELERIARDYIQDLDDSGDEAKAKDYRRWLNRIIGENVPAQTPK